MTITDKEIYNNRLKWIEYLKRPETKKFTENLENPEDPEARCCLGHACHVLAPETRNLDNDGDVLYGDDVAFLPDSLVEQLGMWTYEGGANDRDIFADLGYRACCLSVLNDNTDISPQEIGEYLQTVIMGGEHTPFTKINPEAI
jgi:hypothetical protein